MSVAFAIFCHWPKAPPTGFLGTSAIAATSGEANGPVRVAKLYQSMATDGYIYIVHYLYIYKYSWQSAWGCQLWHNFAGGADDLQVSKLTELGSLMR